MTNKAVRLTLGTSTWVTSVSNKATKEQVKEYFNYVDKVEFIKGFN